MNLLLALKSQMAYNVKSRPFCDVLLESEECRNDFGGAASDGEEDHLSEQSEESDFVDEDEDEDTDIENDAQSACLLESYSRDRPTSVLKGPNGFVWHKQSDNRCLGRATAPVAVHAPGPTGEARNCQTVSEFWDVLFTRELFDIIVECTNLKIEETCLQMIAEKKELQSYHNHTNVDELKAFVGILYHAGLWKSNHLDTHELWSKENGLTFYRCVMTRARFMFLSSCLRFDEKCTRNSDDRLSPIRKVWDIFINNCTKNYTPHQYCTVDEQLLGFRGRCLFRMYKKSKTEKYGLKIITLNDACTSYLIFGIPYLGKTGTGVRNEAISEYYFRKVTTPIHGTNRTVTCDKWFTSIPLLQRMLEPPFKITITGTIRKNKGEIPVEMKVPSKDPPATIFAFSAELSLISHTPKKNKIILLTSSYMRTTTITNGKPEVIQHYNKTKDGTDCFDQLCNSYTTARATLRWPMRFFFGILDQAMVNARILYNCRCVNNNEENNALAAKQCLKRITLHLVEPHLRRRGHLEELQNDLKRGIAGILGFEIPLQQSQERQYSHKRVRCGLCKRHQDHKTQQLCSSCSRPMCDRHRMFICVNCGGEQ